MSISKAVLAGKVVKDPEKRSTTNGTTVTTFSIDVKTPRSDGPNYIRVITWRKLADECAENIKKGQTVVVDGTLQTNTFKDSAGKDKKVVELEANAVEVWEGGSSASTAQKASAKSEPETFEPPPPSEDDFRVTEADLIDEEEIPF